MGTNGSRLRDMERTAYRASWGDGTLDVFVGVGIVLVGIAWRMDMIWMAGALPAVLIPLWKPIRARLTGPRTGSATFSRSRQLRERRGLHGSVWLGAGLLALVVLALVGGSRGSSGGWLGEWIGALPALLIALPLLLTAGVIGAGRFVAYAGALVGLGISGAGLGWEPGPVIVLGGTVITVAGVALLVRFMAAYPVVEEPEP